MSLAEILCAAMLSLSIGDTVENGQFACEQINNIIHATNKNNIDLEIFISLIHYESRFNPVVVSTANACGLTQVIPKWTGGKNTGVRKLTCQELKDPKISIDAGAKTLSYWVHVYGKGKYSIGLCGYNAGYRCKGSSPSKGGMFYSKKVISLSKKIKNRVKKIRLDNRK